MFGVHDFLGGPLRPGDPRRFLIEAMIAARAAAGLDRDGRVELERLVASQPLFEGLTPATAHTLVELAADATRAASGPAAQAAAIARGLPSRAHRLVAFALAGAAVGGDSSPLLEELCLALRLPADEAEALLAAAEGDALATLLPARLARLRGLVPTVARLFALRAAAREQLTDDHRFRVAAFFDGIPELALGQGAVDVALFQAFRAVATEAPVTFTALGQLAAGLEEPVDRYWLLVYALAAELPATISRWRIIPFIGLCQAAFQVADGDVELAVADALGFPPALARAE
ncbi:MAG: hypothetical protein R2939_19600 [Kofleriaceae bacterium]